MIDTKSTGCMGLSLCISYKSCKEPSSEPHLSPWQNKKNNSSYLGGLYGVSLVALHNKSPPKPRASSKNHFA